MISSGPTALFADYATPLSWRVGRAVHRALIPVYVCVSVVFPLLARGGENAGTLLPLHAEYTPYGPCLSMDPCSGVVRTQVDSQSTVAIYLMVRNYSDISGVQTAFSWPQGWNFLFGIWDCQANQVSPVTPSGSGPNAGTLTTSFDCLEDGGTSILGRLHFVAGTGGCLVQVDSSLPFGAHVVGCDGTMYSVVQSARGEVCVGQAGRNACSPIPGGRTDDASGEVTYECD